MYEMTTNVTNSLEKCFLDQLPSAFPTLREATMLKNQHFSFQLVTRGVQMHNFTAAEITAEGVLAPYVTFYDVVNVPVLMPAYYGRSDDNYLRTAPGLYPDLLQPLHYGNRVTVIREQTHAVFITLSPDEAVPAGIYPLTIRLSKDGETLVEHTVTITVLNAVLPEHGMILTQWFHCDSLAAVYNVPVFSERHWELIEIFAKCAAEYGQTMLMTPLFTPPLDTQVGGERLTTQLIDVMMTGGTYTFGFEKLDRWVEMCHRVGIRYFEMSHLFTQWGSEHAPKIVARVDGEEKRIFGWETPATGEEYTAFLHTFLPQLTNHLQELGIAAYCKFHISDEPTPDNLENYRAAKAVVEPYLEGYDIMDALSSFEFFRQGIVKLPIPGNNHIEPFLEAKVPNLWTYYCCGQDREVSNRFIAMPSYRNRIIGAQFFKYDIAGFLQWGFNFYNNMYSCNTINPFLDTCGEAQVEGGDPFLVYPNFDGTPLISLRLAVFREALEDLAAMKLAASLTSKDEVVAAMEKAGGTIAFNRCPHTSGEMLAIRQAVDTLLAKNA